MYGDTKTHNSCSSEWAHCVWPWKGTFVPNSYSNTVTVAAAPKVLWFLVSVSEQTLQWQDRMLGLIELPTPPGRPAASGKGTSICFHLPSGEPLWPINRLHAIFKTAHPALSQTHLGSLSLTHPRRSVVCVCVCGVRWLCFQTGQTVRGCCVAVTFHILFGIGSADEVYHLPLPTFGGCQPADVQKHTTEQRHTELRTCICNQSNLSHPVSQFDFANAKYAT